MSGLLTAMLSAQASSPVWLIREGAGAESAATEAGASSWLVVAGLGALLIAVVIAGVVFWRRRQLANGEDAEEAFLALSRRYGLKEGAREVLRQLAAGLDDVGAVGLLVSENAFRRAQSRAEQEGTLLDAKLVGSVERSVFGHDRT